MSDIVIAVVSGVLILVIGQILQRFFLEPILEQRRLVGEVAFALIYYGNFFKAQWIPNSKTDEELSAASLELRSLASKLRATVWTIPFYGLLSLLGIVYKRKRILAASSGIVGWSNTIFTPGPERKAQTDAIRDALNIKE